MEKQVVGGHSSLLLFYVQMAILATIKGFMTVKPVEIVMPLPIQLHSYMKKMHGIDYASKSTIVAGFKRNHSSQSWAQKRISSHLVDAYYLARLGNHVRAGKWRYKLPSNEEPLVPWKIMNGD
jgi:hypothetical protein